MLNVTFVGGGSLRLLPIVRSLFKSGTSLKGGSVRLCDLKLDRAEAVGRAIQHCPEFKDANCEVMWTDNLDQALEGSDILYITMALEREPQRTLSAMTSVEYDFMCSDQLSLNGAFLSGLGGPMILNFAKKMEKICPDALMLIFANPVSVYSAMVNNHTKIKALGVCAGFGNHRWDLPRLTGKDEYDESIKAVSTGVNHFAFINRGTWGDEDLFEKVDRYLGDDWKPAEITTSTRPEVIQKGLQQLREVYKRFGAMVFSNEGDGIGHIYWEDALATQKQHVKKFSKKEIDEMSAQAGAAIDKKFADFISQVNTLDDSIWNAPPLTNEARLFGVDHTDITNPIFNSLNGDGTFQISASANNAGGAVAGFTDRTALEYSMLIDGKNIQPLEDLYVPAPFYGLISSLAEYQTLLGDAIAANDPRIFADALSAYPKGQFESRTADYLCEMFDIYASSIKDMAKAKDYIKWYK